MSIRGPNPAIEFNVIFILQAIGKQWHYADEHDFISLNFVFSNYISYFTSFFTTESYLVKLSKSKSKRT